MRSLLCAVAFAVAEERYLETELVNTSQLLDKINQLPLSTFTFKYDRFHRRQLGVPAPELTKILPNAVFTVASQPYPNPAQKGEKVLKLSNFLSVDNNVLFMHNVGATQQLSRNIQAMQETVTKIEDENAAVIAEMAQINSDLEADKQKREAEAREAKQKEATRVAEHSARAKQVAVFGPDGEFQSSQAFTFVESDGTLTAPKLVASEAEVSGGTVTGLDSLSAETLTVSGQTELNGDAHITGSLTVAGSVMGSGPYTDSSDVRFKRSIKPLHPTVSLALVKALEGVTYDLKIEDFPTRHFENVSQIGFIAQQVEAVAPQLVRTDAEGYKSVAYSRFVPVLVEAMKEQSKTIEEQASEISTLKSRLLAIEIMLKQL